MVCRNVQCLKVVVVLLHFRTFHHFISHAHENSFHFLQRDAVRMSVTQIIFTGGQSYVNHLGLHSGLSQSFLKLRLPIFQQLLNLCPGLIHHLAHLRSVLRLHILHRFQQISEFSLFPENTYSDLIQFVRGITARNL